MTENPTPESPTPESPTPPLQDSSTGSRLWYWVGGAVLTCGSLVGTYVLMSGREEKPAAPPTKADGTVRQVLADGYVSSKACLECHERQHKTWHASYHRTMTQPVSRETIPDAMKNTVVTVEGRTYKFEQKGDDLWVEMNDPVDVLEGRKPARIRRRIVLITGSHSAHVLWHKTRFDGNLGTVPIIYRIQEKQWIPMNSAFLRPPMSQERRWSGEIGRWNVTCSKCHTTHPRPRPRPESKWDTYVGEFGIACEACHGPGAGHVRIHKKQNPGDLRDQIVNPRKLEDRRASEICGQCHGFLQTVSNESRAQFYEHGHRFRPGQTFAEDGHFRVATMDDFPDQERGDKFWPDGMVRSLGREYNSLLNSPCYQRGKMSCLSCHSMHATRGKSPIKEWVNDQLGPDMRGNKACLQCHKELAEKVPEHTRHGEKSTGSQCMNCHMPHTTYGQLRAGRNHQIDSPDVANGVITGRVVACNQCHLDRTVEWTADYLTKWYGHRKPTLDEDHRTKSVAVLHSLRGDAGQRALMAWSFGWKPAQTASSGTEWMVPYLLTLMEDDYDAVRQIALRSFRTLPEYKDFAFDVFASPEDRVKATQQVREAWMKQNHRVGAPPRANLLLLKDGNVDWKDYLRLLQKRDTRAMHFPE